MGGTCSTSDAKCTSLAGQAGCGSCASTCFSAPAVQDAEDKLEIMIAAAVQTHLAAVLMKLHVPQPLANIAEEAVMGLVDQISPRVSSAPPRMLTSPIASPITSPRQLVYSVPSPVQSPVIRERGLSPPQTASPDQSPI
jgi:hypothetical protein